MLPGKKGISLRVPHFWDLVEAAPHVTEALETQHLTFSRLISPMCARRPSACRIQSFKQAAADPAWLGPAPRANVSALHLVPA